MKKILFICALIAVASNEAAKYTVFYTREHDKRSKVPKGVAIKVVLLNDGNERIREFFVTEGTSKTVTVDEPVVSLEITSPIQRDYDKYRIAIPQDRQDHDFEVRFSNKWNGDNSKATIKDLSKKFKNTKDTPALKYLGRFE